MVLGKSFFDNSKYFIKPQGFSLESPIDLIFPLEIKVFKHSKTDSKFSCQLSSKVELKPLLPKVFVILSGQCN